MHKTLKILITAEVLMTAGFGLTAPIFAIFVNEQIHGGTVVEVGIAVAIYLLVKSLLQIPFAAYSDQRGRRKKFLIAGTALNALVVFGFAFSSDISHVYALQALAGLSAALAVPPWMALFSSNLTKGKEGYEWSIYQTLDGLAAAATAAIGGTLVALIGFRAAFIIVGTVVAVGTLFYATSKIPEKPALHYYHELKKQIAARRRVK
ncbi:MAG: MFS transporter [Candidatus Micrarchaeota archaeon]